MGICEKCKKKNATYHLTAIENGEKKEVHLCEPCAKDTGLGYKFNFSIGNLLGGALGKAAKGSKTKCPNCGFTLADIQKQMRLGCGNDYEFFRDELTKVLKQIHGAEQHTGKVPGAASGVDPKAQKTVELAKLKKELDRIVKDEKYEEAAKLRDQIRTLELELNPPATASEPRKD